jgi:hypothetical protein
MLTTEQEQAYLKIEKAVREGFKIDNGGRTLVYGRDENFKVYSIKAVMSMHKLEHSGTSFPAAVDALLGKEGEV